MVPDGPLAKCCEAKLPINFAGLMAVQVSAHLRVRRCKLKLARPGNVVGGLRKCIPGTWYCQLVLLRTACTAPCTDPSVLC